MAQESEFDELLRRTQDAWEAFAAEFPDARRVESIMLVLYQHVFPLIDAGLVRRNPYAIIEAFYAAALAVCPGHSTPH